jgi:hypothetical protein
MEEAWQSRFGQGSVHLERFPEVEASWRDEALSAKWDKVREVRRVVTGALEIERQVKKTIGSSLEAAPVVYVSDAELLAALDGVDLAEISITSDARLVAGEGPADAFRLDDVAGVAVVPERARGRKCARSWKISEDVGADPEFPDITARDAKAVREWQEASRARLMGEAPPPAPPPEGEGGSRSAAAARSPSGGEGRGGGWARAQPLMAALGARAGGRRPHLRRRPAAQVVDAGAVRHRGAAAGSGRAVPRPGARLEPRHQLRLVRPGDRRRALGADRHQPSGHRRLWLWLAHTRRPVAAAAMGLVIGGALANTMDRIVHGAVADFFLFHGFGFSWYVFNIADTAIFVGVALLLYESFIDGGRRLKPRASHAFAPKTWH